MLEILSAANKADEISEDELLKVIEELSTTIQRSNNDLSDHVLEEFSKRLKEALENAELEVQETDLEVS